ncbi:HD-GYP domain-containing protein [Anaerosolibacter sp.]|uniref:HD-GYP domain-containing protein n=1 Tax=Anaerosolibacter sp. TaxID=1872527 RepID=UPI0039EE137B
MLFCLNDFLRSVANTIDVVETDIFGVPTNHSKRIAYISSKIAVELGLPIQDVFDLISFAILHDNGASLKVLHDSLRGDSKERLSLIENMQEHCIIGEENIKHYPFLNTHHNIIKYHHERYDGSGFFNIAGDDIPVMSQIINFADTLDLNYDLRNVKKSSSFEERIVDFIEQQRNKFFSTQIVDAFFNVIEEDNFWDKLSNQVIEAALKEDTPSFSKDLTYEQIHNVTKTFSKIIDAKSQFTQAHSAGLADKVERMAAFYDINHEDKMKLLIAADLHDLGKLAVKNDILDKPGNLTREEFEEIKAHPSVTRSCLQEIKGFQDIAEWAGNHHEKLDGTGYPRGLSSNQLDFHSRLLACLDIYQALREERPYRKEMSHIEAMTILRRMANENLIDAEIVKDIDNIFREER